MVITEEEYKEYQNLKQSERVQPILAWFDRWLRNVEDASYNSDEHTIEIRTANTYSLIEVSVENAYRFRELLDERDRLIRRMMHFTSYEESLNDMTVRCADIFRELHSNKQLDELTEELL